MTKEETIRNTRKLRKTRSKTLASQKNQQKQQNNTTTNKKIRQIVGLKRTSPVVKTNTPKKQKKTYTSPVVVKDYTTFKKKTAASTTNNQEEEKRRYLPNPPQYYQKRKQQEEEEVEEKEQYMEDDENEENQWKDKREEERGEEEEEDIEEIEYELTEDEMNEEEEEAEEEDEEEEGRKRTVERVSKFHAIPPLKIWVEPCVMSYKGQHTSKSYPRKLFECNSIEELRRTLFFSYHHHLYYSEEDIDMFHSPTTKTAKINYILEKFLDHMECYDVVSKSRYSLPTLSDKQVRSWERKSRPVHLNIYQNGIISRMEHKDIVKKNLKIVPRQDLPKIHIAPTPSQFPTVKRRSISKLERDHKTKQAKQSSKIQQNVSLPYKVHILPTKPNPPYSSFTTQSQRLQQQANQTTNVPAAARLRQEQPYQSQPLPVQQPQQPIIPLVNDSRRLSQNFYIGPKPRLSTGPSMRNSNRYSTSSFNSFNYYRPSDEFGHDERTPPPPSIGEHPKSPPMPIPSTVKEMVIYLKRKHPNYEAHDEAYWRSWAVAALQHRDPIDGVTQDDILNTPPASIMNGFIIHNRRNSSILNSPPMYDSFQSSYQHLYSRFQKNMEDLVANFYHESRQFFNRRFSVMGSEYYVHDPFPPPVHEMPPHRKSTGYPNKADEHHVS
mmetsp:Transcript_1346/g.2019  ORF Transcript_1346/g.2019 Transcript_1346/m.2019 type:complete len:664 (-) Transcript_1346:12-2003(-)